MSERLTILALLLSIVGLLAAILALMIDSDPRWPAGLAIVFSLASLVVIARAWRLRP